jgi:hypothetical protein
MISSITTLILGLAITAILGLMDWYAWRTAPVLRYPLESTGTRPPYAQDDAVNSKKGA